MRDDKINIKNIYIDIDSLLDTRITILKELLPEFTEDYLKDENHPYFYRTNNSFKYRDYTIPDTLFMELYKYRSKNVLKESKPTILSYLMLNVLDDVFKSIEVEDKNEKPAIIVNVYPYKLTEEEQALFQLYLYNFIPSVIPIEMVYKPIEELTPDYFKSKSVIDIYMYNGYRWLEYIVSNMSFLDAFMVDKTLFLPKFFSNNLKTEETVGDLYELFTYSYSNIIRLEFLELSAYVDKEYCPKKIEEEYLDQE